MTLIEVIDMAKKQENPNQELHDRIEELVLSYQQGNEDAGMELLRLYGGNPAKEKMSRFLGKYYRLIREAKIRFEDRDSRMFVNLFIENKDVRNSMYYHYQSKETRNVANVTMKKVKTNLKFLTDEEIKQELRCIFLYLCKRYKKTNRNFGAYLYNYYRFEAMRFVKNITKYKEPYVHMHSDLLHIAEDLVHDREMDIEVNEKLFGDAPMMLSDDELGNSWVRGLTCGEEFQDLTPLQRLILKMNHFDGYSDRMIGEKMGIHINTIFRQRTKAAETIAATIKRMTEEGRT